MAEAVLMPRQGQSVETCIITQWLKQKGDQVEEGDLLFSYETDKAAFDEPAGANGKLLEILFEEGDEVPVLSTVAIIGKEGEDISGLLEEGGDKGATASSTADTPEKPGEAHLATHRNEQTSKAREKSVTKGSDRLRISPRARNMATDLGVDIGLLHGSGPNGRIISDDVIAASERSEITKRAQPDASKAQAPTPEGEYTDKTLSNIRKIIAKNMQRSLQHSAQLTHHASTDARKILNLRKLIKAQKEERLPSTTTLNDMICYAIVDALKAHPEMNAHFLDDTTRSFHGVHMGIAVDTERGLMVPVLKNADRFTLGGLGQSLRELAESCRNGTIDPDLLAPTAGSFTVSNLGAYGIEMFTPVLNLPQCGIMGINTITQRPADLGDGTIGFVPYLGLSLTYDHRAVDGAPASAFLKSVCDRISNFDPKL